MGKWNKEHQNELDVKAAVRARDGHRCRECGISEQDHINETGNALDVHRLLPGSVYTVEDCIALCRACHGKKPKSIDQLFYAHDAESTGVLMAAWNVTSPEGRAMYAVLGEIAEAEKIGVEQLVGDVLERWAREIPQSYCI